MRKRMKDTELKTYVSKLNQKRESLLTDLLKLEEQRRNAQKQLERRMRLRAKEAVTPIDPTLSDSVADIVPVRAIPYSEAHPYSKWAKAKEAADSHRATAEPAPDLDAANKVPTRRDDIAVKDDGIPNYLRRDQIAREKIESELAAAKKAKADRAAKKRAIKRDMVQADLTGQTRRMPLQGKDALAAIMSLKR